MVNITIEEINRLYNMLDSKDTEMQELGIVATKARFPDSWPLYFAISNRISCLKQMLSSKAYNLGVETGTQLKERYGNNAKNKGYDNE